MMSKEAKEYEQKLEALEHRVERLKALYDQYFQGIERLAPSMERTNVKRAIQELRKNRLRNTSLKFRTNQLLARINTYENYWNRVCRQIEEGTYARHVQLARFRTKHRHNLTGVEEGNDQSPASKSETPDRPEPAKPPAAAASSVSGLSQDKLSTIYKTYMLAKKRCQENTTGITPKALASSLNKQVPAIIKQYKCKSVEFKVVIRKGKTVLKAVPKF